MFKVNQIDENHLQFSGYYDDVNYDFESYKEAIDEYKINSMEYGTSISLGSMKGDKIPVKVDEASHCITDVNMDNNGMVYGVLEILNTPEGKVLKETCDRGYTNYLNVIPVADNDKILTFNIHI